MFYNADRSHDPRQATNLPKGARPAKRGRAATGAATPARPRATRRQRLHRNGRAMVRLGGDNWRNGWVSMRVPMWFLIALVVAAIFLANPAGVSGQLVVGFMQFLDWLSRPKQP